MAGKNKPSVSCLVPTYNEQAHIGSILEILTSLDDVLSEIIVIDDGSTDSTKEIVAKFSGVKLISNPVNRGKSYSISEGLRVAHSDLIFMCDGDLIGLNQSTVKNLVTPLLEGIVDITISFRDNTPHWWINLFKVETFSGERCFPATLLEDDIDRISKLPGYGLEVFINDQIIRKKFRIGSVRMNYVTIDYKWHKYGWTLGIWRELKMWKQIFSVVNPFKLGKQVFQMKKRAVRL